MLLLLGLFQTLFLYSSCTNRPESNLHEDPFNLAELDLTFVEANSLEGSSVIEVFDYIYSKLRDTQSKEPVMSHFAFSDSLSEYRFQNFEVKEKLNFPELVEVIPHDISILWVKKSILITDYPIYKGELTNDLNDLNSMYCSWDNWKGTNVLRYIEYLKKDLDRLGYQLRVEGEPD